MKPLFKALLVTVFVWMGMSFAQEAKAQLTIKANVTCPVVAPQAQLLWGIPGTCNILFSTYEPVVNGINNYVIPPGMELIGIEIGSQNGTFVHASVAPNCFVNVPQYEDCGGTFRTVQWSSPMLIYIF